MEHQFIVNIEGTIVAVQSGNFKALSREVYLREKREMYGRHLGLVEKVSELHNKGLNQEAAALLESNPEALENSIVQLLYCTVLREQGYHLLASQRPAEAISHIKKACIHAEKCEDRFDKEKWRYEADSLRFLLQKNLGDCHFDIAKILKKEADITAWLAALANGERSYVNSLDVWNRKLNGKREVFSDTAISNFFNLGNLYTNWAHHTFINVDPYACAFGNEGEIEKAKLAILFIKRGISLQNLSLSLYNTFLCQMPQFLDAYEDKNKEAQSLQKNIGILELIISTNPHA